MTTSTLNPQEFPLIQKFSIKWKVFGHLYSGVAQFLPADQEQGAKMKKGNERFAQKAETKWPLSQRSAVHFIEGYKAVYCCLLTEKLKSKSSIYQ